MKISYNDISLEKDFKHFKEWYLLCNDIDSIKMKGIFKNKNFIKKNLFILLLNLLVFLIIINIYNNSDKLFINILGLSLIGLSLFTIFSSILTFINYFTYFHSFKKEKINKDKNSLTIDEEGIIDATNELSLSSKWEQLTHVLLGEYYIVFTTSNNDLYLFPIDIKEKIMANVNKYNNNNNLKIIFKK